MVILITILHIIVCIALILIVLLQAGKGGDIASAFGGGSSQTVFGSRTGTMLTRLTTAAAIIFMLTSLLFSCENLTVSSISKKAGKEQVTSSPAPAPQPSQTPTPAPAAQQPGQSPASQAQPPAQTPVPAAQQPAQQ
ncbi:MAG: preprotein translocase subunit SecG [Lentisphaerae bacterium GWF2_52_8]|nr:MAG: preprotein translocase subunit SecG [Lentisphaerae bacterium GWF2_52_8]